MRTHPNAQSLPAMEINIFQLIEGVSLDEFLRANRCVDVWLRRQPGFRSRQIAQQSDGTLIDVLIWEHAEAGIEAMHRLHEELGDAFVHRLVDPRSARWTLADVVQGMAVAGSQGPHSASARRPAKRRQRPGTAQIPVPTLHDQA